jgi:lysophospholipase L1-like esterase
LRVYWGRAIERLGRRGAALAAAGAVVLLVALVVVPLSRSGGKLDCDKSPRPQRCPALAPWPKLSVPPRPLSPVEIATQGEYVALGDSYSAGEGAYASPADTASANVCHRTSQAYPQIIGRDFRFAHGMAFWACSGARTSNILHGQHGEPPQVNRLSTDTSLVTISIGGNDTGFSTVLAGCVLKLPWSSGCRSQGLEVGKRLETLRGSMKALLQTITAKAPNARVLVVGYPRIFSDSSNWLSNNLGTGDLKWLNERGLEIDQLLRQVVRDQDNAIQRLHWKGSCEYVDTFSAFTGHEVGSSAPYVNNLDMNLMGLTAEPDSFHPTAAGYKVLADLVRRQIEGGPGRTILQFR